MTVPVLSFSANKHTHKQLPPRTNIPRRNHRINPTRRAKILRKLERLLTGSAAQSSTTRFRATWMVLLALAAVHVVGFGIVTTEIEARYS